MFSKKLYSLVLFFFLVAICFPQSKIKMINGEVSKLINGKKAPLIGLNMMLNDTSTLFFSSENDYMIIESDNKHKIIRASKDYIKGFKIINYPEPKKDEDSNEFWLKKALSALFNNEFNEKKKIDDLYITQFQGVTRSLFDNSKNNQKIHLSYFSKIKWNGSKIEIRFNNKKILFINNSNISSYIIDKNNYLFKKCSPCKVFVDNNENGLLISSILNSDEEELLRNLFKNIDDNHNSKLSQLLVIKLFIENEMYFNAFYYIDKYDDNELISDYLISMKM